LSSPQIERCRWLTYLQDCEEFVKSLARDNAKTLTFGTSALERHGTALFLQPSIQSPPTTRRTMGEICHLHTNSDCSSHIMLSYADAREVVNKQWGERHPLSGAKLPLGFTLLYAPRDDAEFEVMKDIFRASVKFMSGEEDLR